MFSKYHYLNSELSPAAKCFLLTVNEKIAGFMAVIHFPHPIKCYKKVHRLVILPDYQGLGLGKIFLNKIGELINYDFAITTSQPALINSLKNDVQWICTSQQRGSKVSKTGKQSMNKTASIKRIITTFVYKGNYPNIKKSKNY